MPNIGGPLFGTPWRTALLVSALKPQKFAIAAAHERETALHETDSSAAQIVRFPDAIRYALFPEQGLCDAAIGGAGEIRGDRPKGRA